MDESLDPGSSTGAALLWLRAGDGAVVVAHRFDAPTPRGVVVIGAALGVAQSFYRDFAAWLAGGLPLFVVGHSMGAQLVALIPSAQAVRAMVAVAGGSGYWRGFPAAMRPLMLAMLHGVASLSMPLAGYFPGRRFGMIGDLPMDVMRQWRRWCMNADYLVGVEPGAREAYARARFDLLSLTFTDDAMMPQRNVDSLHAHLLGVRRESRRISPSEAGGPIGHVGFFRRRYRESLWPIAADWLDTRIAGTAGAANDPGG